MKRRIPFYLFTVVLALSGIALMIYRHIVYDIPWLPGESRQLWTIEAKIEFEAGGSEVNASLAIPESQPGFEKIKQYTASPGYGLAFVNGSSQSRAEWSKRSANGDQTLYYRVDMLETERRGQRELPSNTRLVVPFSDSPFDTLAEEMLKNSQMRSSNAETLTRELIKEFNQQSESATFLEQRMSRLDWLVRLLNIAEVPALKISVLNLEDGRRRQQLQTYLTVFSEGEEKIFNPRNAEEGLANSQLVWESDAVSLLDVVGGQNSRVYFSVIAQEVTGSSLLSQAKPDPLNFSIHSLPVEDQALFKGILLVPMGVLIVVIFRLLVGVRTSGTFMPVLIAIAFLQTSLIPGLIGFLVILFFGLAIRGYLSRLNLLLVARISSVIIAVIGIISLLAIVSYKLGWTEGLKITFFPMIILSWTIERMSILWEEEGPKEVARQGGGSLLVALVCYGVMVNDVIRHITFNFLGLQLVILALVLILGTYTGYRLTELRRFGPLASRD